MAPNLTNSSLAFNYTIPTILTQQPMVLPLNNTPQACKPQEESIYNPLKDPFIWAFIIFVILNSLIATLAEYMEEREHSVRETIDVEMGYPTEKDTSSIYAASLSSPEPETTSLIPQLSPEDRAFWEKATKRETMLYKSAHAHSLLRLHNEDSKNLYKRADVELAKWAAATLESERSKSDMHKSETAAMLAKAMSKKTMNDLGFLACMEGMEEWRDGQGVLEKLRGWVDCGEGRVLRIEIKRIEESY